jgi:hypothetical protein
LLAAARLLLAAMGPMGLFMAMAGVAPESQTARFVANIKVILLGLAIKAAFKLNIQVLTVPPKL